MKFFDTGPFGTKILTPQGQQWIGIVILVLALCGFGLEAIPHQKTPIDSLNLISFSGMVVMGVVVTWAGYRRSRKWRLV
jgi:hypothetical protein